VRRSPVTVALWISIVGASLIAGVPTPVAAGSPLPGPASPTDAANPPPVADGPVVLANGEVLPVMPEAVDHPSVMAEMLAQHDGEVPTFIQGPVPADFTPIPPDQPGTVDPAGPRDSPEETQAPSGAPYGERGQLVGTASLASVRNSAIASAAAAAPLPNGLQKEVFGFLPYWMLDDSKLQWLRYDLVTTIAYFGIGVQTNGSLAIGSNGWNGWYSPEMTEVISNAHARGVRVVLTVTMMAWDGGAGQAVLLSDPAARDLLVRQIVSTVRDRGADGVNLDFEPVYTPQRDQYTSFVRQLKAGLQAAGVGSWLTVCTMAGAATWATGYDLAALVAPGAADAVFVMGYDYSWSGSSLAGGVAPIESPYMLDVNQSVNDYLRVIPGGKIIWGVPYYGRTWQTTSDALNASTRPGSASASVAYYYPANQVLQARYGRRWDPVGQVPWFAYWDAGAGTWVEGYYDDAQSLGIKWDLVNQRGLAGTGMWSLLMDQGSADLWNVLATKFLYDTSPPTGGIMSLPPVTESSAIAVAWRAFDVGSGVASYSVEVRDRLGGAWTPWLTDVSWTSAPYVGVEGHSYEFRVSAMDQRGNRQPWTSDALDVGGALQVGGFAWAAADGLNVRSGAGTGYAVLDRLAAGDRVALLGGPVNADGYAWFRVQFTFTEWPSADYPRYGWVATGPAGDPWLTPAPAPTVSALEPAITGYAASPHRLSPNGDGVDDGAWVAYTLAADASAVQLDILGADGAVRRALPLGSETAGAHMAAWDGRVNGGSWAPEGVYLLRLTVVDATGTHTAPVPAVDAAAMSTWGLVASTTPPGATYVPLPPSRLLDTRVGSGLAGRFSASVPRTFTVAGRGGVPASAVAVTGTLTVTNQTHLGYVFLGPSPVTGPASSTLNFPVGDNRAAGATVALSPTGTLSATYAAPPGATTDLLFDVTGYFLP
jgi:spore germination protein YaaH